MISNRDIPIEIGMIVRRIKWSRLNEEPGPKIKIVKKLLDFCRCEVIELGKFHRIGADWILSIEGWNNGLYEIEELLNPLTSRFELIEL